MYNYPVKVQRLINEISKLPGIGNKMAERITLHILKQDRTFIENLSGVIYDVQSVNFCEKCFNISEDKLCEICKDNTRDSSIICVVESPLDIINIERTGKFSGIYHILSGLINPLNNVLPENLKIIELVKRVKEEKKLKEIMLAINHTVEGDTTALYIISAIGGNLNNVKITRLAKGLPTGSDIKYADEMTLGQAILERKEI
ncbi:MAG: recombination protein RecR [Candidatus Goldbacteria bacterium]|nr:recombination protein RecR [Candidatus Goldiibacteriota bacterium]HPD18160.1 recombination mediator RecR [Candidatus Goldiibacteriota bacterium]